jgi:hypothetical protein
LCARRIGEQLVVVQQLNVDTEHGVGLCQHPCGHAFAACVQLGANLRDGLLKRTGLFFCILDEAVTNSGEVGCRGR